MDAHLVDVTEKVQSMLTDDGTKLFMYPNEQMLGIEDIPTHNKRVHKSLFVTYSFEDRPEQLVFANLAGPVSLPMKKPNK